ncbi:hypothetical protein GCM10009780_69710 [Actinomadura alba]
MAWEWLPDRAIVRTGRLTAEGEALSFQKADEWAPMWTSPHTRAGFQALKDLTALFAEECNIVPGDVRIIWVADERAVSWCRSTGELSRHDVMPPGEGASPAVLAAVKAHGGETADLRTADARARAELGR